MKRSSMIVVGLCCLALIAGTAAERQNRNERASRYEDKTEQHEDKTEKYEDKAEQYEDKAEKYEAEAEAYEDKAQQYEAKEGEYEDKAQQYDAKADEYGNKFQQYQGKSGTYFENFDAEIKRSQYVVTGTANLAEDDENAILAELNISKTTTISINGTIEYKKGKADLYLISPNDKTCILSYEEIQGNGEVEKTVDLEEGCNQIILKGEDCIAEFELEFHSENMPSLILR